MFEPLKSTNLQFSCCYIFASFRNKVGLSYLTTTLRSALQLMPIRMTLNDPECPIQLNVRFAYDMIDVVCCGFRSWSCV